MENTKFKANLKHVDCKEPGAGRQAPGNMH